MAGNRHKKCLIWTSLTYILLMMRTGWEQFQNCEKLQKSDFRAY